MTTTIKPRSVGLRTPEPRHVELVIGLGEHKAAVFELTLPQLMLLSAEAATAVLNWHAWGQR